MSYSNNNLHLPFKLPSRPYYTPGLGISTFIHHNLKSHSTHPNIQREPTKSNLALSTHFGLLSTAVGANLRQYLNGDVGNGINDIRVGVRERVGRGGTDLSWAIGALVGMCLLHRLGIKEYGHGSILVNCTQYYLVLQRAKTALHVGSSPIHTSVQSRFRLL